MWRDENRDQAQVLDDIQQIRTRHLATTRRVVRSAVRDRRRDVRLGSRRSFPIRTTMLQALHDAGLRYGDLADAVHRATRATQDPAPAQLDYATQHGFFPPLTGVLVNPWGKPIDFTNPDAYAWWQQNLRAYTDRRRTASRASSSTTREDIVVGAARAAHAVAVPDGSDERTMHYGYSCSITASIASCCPPTGGLLLTRTGRWGDQVNGMIIWPGDLDASFVAAGDAMPGQSTNAVGGLPAAVTKGIGAVGVGLSVLRVATPAATATRRPNNEVWLRWVEANAVMPAMEVGDSSSQMPWEFTAAERPRPGLARHVRALRVAAPAAVSRTRGRYAQQIAHDGPADRAAARARVSRSSARIPRDEYALGDSLLVAPVVARGPDLAHGAAAARRRGCRGGTARRRPATITAPADLDTLPLYLARGAIVPMLRRHDRDAVAGDATRRSTRSRAIAGVLYVRVAPGPASSFTVYDGTQLAQAASTVSLHARPVFTKGAMFEVIATAQPARVRRD